MTTDQKIEILSYHPLFKQFNDQELRLLAEKISKKIFAPKTVMIRQGEEADALYLLYKGLARAYTLNEKGNEITLNFLGTNEIVGEMAIVDGGKRSAFVAAVQETHVLELTISAFAQLLHDNPMFARRLLKILSSRIRNLVTVLEINSAQDLKRRTLHVLHTLVRYFTKRELPFSHEELALIIGCTRPRLTEILRELEKEGILSLTYRKVVLH
jgi:CRP/FNR family transcriptional regulator